MISSSTTNACQTILEETNADNRVQSVAYAPSGQQLASSGKFDKNIKLWNLGTMQCQATLEGHNDWVHSVAYAPSGRQLASASSDQSVKLWDIS